MFSTLHKIALILCVFYVLGWPPTSLLTLDCRTTTQNYFTSDNYCLPTIEEPPFPCRNYPGRPNISNVCIDNKTIVISWRPPAVDGYVSKRLNGYYVSVRFYSGAGPPDKCYKITPTPSFNITRNKVDLVCNYSVPQNVSVTVIITSLPAANGCVQHFQEAVISNTNQKVSSSLQPCYQRPDSAPSTAYIIPEPSHTKLPRVVVGTTATVLIIFIIPALLVCKFKRESLWRCWRKATGRESSTCDSTPGPVQHPISTIVESSQYGPTSEPDGYSINTAAEASQCDPTLDSAGHPIYTIAAPSKCDLTPDSAGHPINTIEARSEVHEPPIPPELYREMLSINNIPVQEPWS